MGQHLDSIPFGSRDLLPLKLEDHLIPVSSDCHKIKEKTVSASSVSQKRR
jgi:hypothetical protein